MSPSLSPLKSLLVPNISWKIKFPALQSLSAPTPPQPVQTLDTMLAQLSPILYVAKEIFQKHEKDFVERSKVLQLLETAENLRRQFESWPSAQSGSWAPRSLEPQLCPDHEGLPDMSVIAGPWTVYFDCKWQTFPAIPLIEVRLVTRTLVYVAAVWNTYRKAHLLVVEVVAQCKCRLRLAECLYTHTATQEEAEARKLADEIAATIPFHLLSRLQRPEVFDGLTTGLTTGPTPAPVAGALLLMHPLWVVQTCLVSHQPTKELAREALGWIGSNTGIGQASLLADVSIDRAHLGGAAE